MTNANIMNLGTMNPNAMNAVVGGKQKNATEAISGMFAAYMKQPDVQVKLQLEQSNRSVDAGRSEFDRYQFQDKSLEEGKIPTLSDKVNSAKEELEEFGEEVMQVLEEELGVDAEELTKAMEEMGLGIFDMLNPQNLVQLVMHLNGNEDTAELLVDTDFLNILEQIGELGEKLMEEMNLDLSEIDQFLEQMEAFEAPVEFEDVLSGEMAAVDETANLTVNPEVIADETDAKTNQPKVMVEDLRTQKEAAEEFVTLEEDTKQPGNSLGEDTGSSRDFMGRNDRKQTPVMEEAVFHAASDYSSVADAVSTATSSEMTAYTTIDAMDMLEQVAEKMRVVLSNGESSMEIQLNPENLGKVYLNISTREGIVNAQIAAQNEAVKQALEAQLADLRENLNNSGVKVNSIEITIATHEFERNLEQNQQDQREHQEPAHKGRRHLVLDSLDELSGLMTEEESLVAQIMRDNGNSVDYTA